MPLKILVSACLLGQRVRYDGSAKTLHDQLLDHWQAEGRILALCPEVAAGLPTPRPPAELAPGCTADDILDGRGQVIEEGGALVTSAFRAGAEIALELAHRHLCRFALLTEGSPSCGSQMVYDGHFAARRIAGQGVVAALLRRHGVAVFAPAAIADLAAALAVAEGRV